MSTDKASRYSRRILFTLYGSAGDLFPMIPIALELRQRGHDVRFCVPRALALYLRALRLPAIGMGSGAEMRAFTDPRMITTRLHGWASWRTLLSEYIAPGLGGDVATIEKLASTWRPHVVVTGSFATPGRVAARRLGIPALDVSIYPQHESANDHGRRFARALRATVADLLKVEPDDPLTSSAIWGDPDGILLHDPQLLRCEVGRHRVVGFPYWDQSAGEPGAQGTIERWASRNSGRPLVLVTLGSFLGARQANPWSDSLAAVRRLGARALFIGPRGNWEGGIDASDDVLAVGFTPLSYINIEVDAVVHHGGIGTSFGTIRAGRPALVLPQAFDQSFNARQIEAAHVGIDGSVLEIDAALSKLLEDSSFRAAAQGLSGALLPTASSVDAVASAVLGTGQ